MPPRKRRLSGADQALWAQYTRQIAPLPGKAPKPLAPLAPAPLAPAPLAPAPLAVPPAPVAADTAVPPRPVAPRLAGPRRHGAAALAVGAQPAGLDSGTWNRFRGGKLPVARTLDLHGMTVQRAYSALMAFLRSAHAEQMRVVEVVTGRGSGETGGAIRRELPLWLNQPEDPPDDPGRHPSARAEPRFGAADPAADPVTPFGARLRGLRAARGITLRQLAENLQVSAAYLSALEHGRRGAPSAGLVHQVNEFFGLIWDEAEELSLLARLSNPRVTVNTAGLTPEQTALANRLAQAIHRLSPETVAALHAVLDTAPQQGKPRLRRSAQSIRPGVRRMPTG